MDKKYFIHEYIKNTNLERPFNGSISYNQFPTQEDDVGSIIDLDFYNQWFTPGTNQPGEHYDHMFNKKFIVARHDKFSIYDDAKVVYISTDYDHIIVYEKDKIIVNIAVPEVLKHLVGLKVKAEYRDGDEREAYIIAVQGLEPGFAVIAEYLDEVTYRILLDTDIYFTYNPNDIYVPTLDPNLREIRKTILEGRYPYNG